MRLSRLLPHSTRLLGISTAKVEFSDFEKNTKNGKFKWKMTVIIIMLIIIYEFVYRNSLSACQACCYHWGSVLHITVKHRLLNRYSHSKCFSFFLCIMTGCASPASPDCTSLPLLYFYHIFMETKSIPKAIHFYFHSIFICSLVIKRRISKTK